jgi:hypothetical protein
MSRTEGTREDRVEALCEAFLSSDATHHHDEPTNLADAVAGRECRQWAT